MGGLNDGLRARRGRAVRGAVACLVLALAAAAGCSSTGATGEASTPQRSGGFYHAVGRGENLYRIGLRYGVPAEVLREVNEIGDVRALRVGQRLWIPPVGARQRSRSGTAGGSSTGLDERVAAQAAARSGVAFRWPLRGRMTSRFGRRRGSNHDGIDISARRGTPVLAAEAGKVIFAGRMRDYGRIVILKHSGHYRSVYAHLDRIGVRRGAFVERGQPIGRVGTSGNASGPHLHFEIRERDRARDPIGYLP